MRTLLLAATLLAGMACGQDAVTYASLAERVVPFGGTVRDRSITIVTTDGARHRGRDLRLGADGLHLFETKTAGVYYPKERIARIEITPGPRHFRRIGREAKDIVEITGLFCQPGAPVACLIGGPIAMAASTARAGIKAPFHLIGGVVDVFTPREVYRIVP